jgi:glycosyltransferase involved in cell wall biosynthesis
MQCLWLTLADPEPATNGQLIYSKGLIEAACRAGASLTVIGLARPENPRVSRDPRGIDWRLAEERRKSAKRRLLSRDPIVTQRGSPAMERMLEHTLAERPWDTVVFDSLCAGWALHHVMRHRARSARPPRIVYIAHNHEVTVARRIAATAQGLRRIVREIDLLKVIGLEHRLISVSDIVTSNTPDDCRRFAADSGGRPIVFLPPGYDGPRVTSRKIDAGVPRRAVLVGSLDWPPKRISLESFLAVATEPLLHAGIELQIVGEVETSYLADLRRRFSSVDFVGPVTDVRPYMQDARMALVPDQLGGFKLKGLDYVFNRLPILAMRIALPGMPLEDGRSIGLFDSHRALAQGVVALIDDFSGLNARQERAYAACADRFDWDRIGRHLVAHMRGTSDRRLRAGPADRTADAVSRSARLAAGR